MRYEQQRKELAEICRRLYDRNLVTACDGNVSMRVSGEEILITPSGRNKGFLKPEDMLLVSMEGVCIDGVGKASKEFPLHGIIYENRSDVAAIIHTHPVFVTAFAMAGKNLPDQYLVESRVLLGKCGLAEYAPAGTKELAESILPFVHNCKAVILKNHGAVVYDKTLMDAYNRMEVFESIAKTTIMSSVIGKPVPIPEGFAN